MKAIVCKEFGPPSSLVYEDVELPEELVNTPIEGDDCDACTI